MVSPRCVAAGAYEGTAERERWAAPRREFVPGRWKAHLRVAGSGRSEVFPAWWLLGARNNEPPVQEADETVR